MKKRKLKILSEKLKYKGQWADVIGMKIDLGNGKIVEWEGIREDDCVAIVALDKNNNVYLGKEYRPVHRKYIYQIASGSGEGGSLKKQARTELREELGVDSKNIQKLATVCSAGRIKSKWHIYIATNVFSSPLKSKEYESIEVIKLPINEALKLLLSKDCHFTALLGVLLAKEKLHL